MSDLNDPRVLFAAERTLLAWTRTSISLMAFGFVIERFGLFLHGTHPQGAITLRHFSFAVGLAFILLAAFIAGYSIRQYRRVLNTLRPVEIPLGYNVGIGMLTNGILALLGLSLSLYLALSLI
jgi:putative membrane protein